MCLIRFCFIIESCALQFLKKIFSVFITLSPAVKPVHIMTHPFHLYNIPPCIHLFFLLYFDSTLTNACQAFFFFRCTFVVAIGLSPTLTGLQSSNFEGLSAFSLTKHICHGFAFSTPLSLRATDSHCRGCPSVQSTWGLRCKQFDCNCIFPAVTP